MLEVVEKEQEALLAEEVAQTVRNRPIASLPHIKHLGHSRGDEIGVSDRTESDKPDPVREGFADRGGDLEGESSLAHPAGTGQRQESGLAAAE